MQAWMSLSLLRELSSGSSVSGAARRTCTVNSVMPRSTVSGSGSLHSGTMTTVAGPTVSRCTGQADVDRDRVRACVQPIQMRLKKGRMTAADPQPLPHAVAEDEAGIEDRDHGPCPGQQLSIDADQNPLVTWIVVVVMRPTGHLPTPASRACSGLAGKVRLPAALNSVIRSYNE